LTLLQKNYRSIRQRPPHCSRWAWRDYVGSGGLHNPKQVQYDENDGNNDQSMDPIASAWETWTDVSTEKAEQPQHEQNYDDGPNHEISPIE
jgi:hypothetical protein